MNPYDYVTDNIVESVERVTHSEIGSRMWDGSQNPVDFLHEVAGRQLAGEYLAAVQEYMEARELMEWRAPAERLFRATSQPLVQQFLHNWNVNSRVDELAVLLGVVSSLNMPTISVGDLGCGPGQITNIIGALIKGRVVGVDRVNYWNHATRHRVSNAEFLQQDVIHEQPQEQFDIIYANGLKQHCDPRRFWEAVANWLRP